MINYDSEIWKAWLHPSASVKIASRFCCHFDVLAPRFSLIIKLSLWAFWPQRMFFTGHVAQTSFTKSCVFVQVPSQFRWRAGAQRPGPHDFFCIARNIFSRSVIIFFFNRNAYSGLFHNIHAFHTLLKLCLILLKLISSPHKWTSHINRSTRTPACCALYVPQGWKHIWLTHTNHPLLSGLSFLGQIVDVHRARRRNKSNFPSLRTVLHPQDCTKGRSASVLQRTFSRQVTLDEVV